MRKNGYFHVAQEQTDGQTDKLTGLHTNNFHANTHTDSIHHLKEREKTQIMGFFLLALASP